MTKIQDINIPEGWKLDSLWKYLTIKTWKTDVNVTSLDWKYRYYSCAKNFMYSNTYSFDTEALLISWNWEYVGYVHYYKGKFEAYQRTYVLDNFKNDLFIFYIQWFLNRNLRPRINKEKNSWNIPFIKFWTLYDMAISFPQSIKEQVKITEILSTVDEAIGNTDRLIEKYKKIKIGLMEDLFTKWIDINTWKPHTKFKESVFGRIPDCWEVEKLSNFVNTNSDIIAWPFGSNLKTTDYIEDNSWVPILRLQNIKENKFINKEIKYISKQKARTLDYHSFKLWDIAMAKLWDNVWESCIIPDIFTYWIVVADVVRIRVNENKLNKSYLIQILNTPICLFQFQKEIIWTTRQRVNLQQVRNLNILKPKDTKEQEKIAEILTEADSKIETEEAHKEKLEKIKKWLMNDLLTGKVRVKF